MALLVSCQTTKLKASIGFSPGEYLKGIHLAVEMKTIAIPILVTSTIKEIEQVRKLTRYVNPKNIFMFEPPVEGFHGSKALWKSVKGHKHYWKALQQFFKVALI